MHSGRGYKRKVDLCFEFQESFVFQQSFVLSFWFPTNFVFCFALSASNKFCVVCFAFFVSKKVGVSKGLLHNFT